MELWPSLSEKARRIPKENAPPEGRALFVSRFVFGLPGVWAFGRERADQEVDKGADLGLCEPARRINRVDALVFGWQFRDRLLHQTLFHGVTAQEGGQVSDAEARNSRIQQALTIVHGQPASGAHLALFT